jgi:hypothetical protein
VRRRRRVAGKKAARTRSMRAKKVSKRKAVRRKEKAKAAPKPAPISTIPALRLQKPRQS